MRKPILACAAVALITGTTTATAASLITSEDIENGTIRAADVQKGAISANRLSRGVQAALAEKAKPGPTGKDGATVYGPERLRPATYSSSPVLVEGRIYITDEDGVTSILKAGPKFEVLGENSLGEYTLSSPAIVSGQIFMRTDNALYAIGQRRP